MDAYRARWEVSNVARRSEALAEDLFDEETLVAPVREREAPPGSVALVHDYLATIGGAERVVVSLTRAFPDAPLYTSLYNRDRVSPELASGLDVRASRLNRVGLFRNNYRAAMPALAGTFNRMHVDADVVLCSSSGWAHGTSTRGRKVVYCYNPARWLYQPTEFFAGGQPHWRLASAALRPYLLRWDRKAAASCERYMVVSSVVAQRVKDVYGIEADIVPPPVRLDAAGPQRAIEDIDSGFMLYVGRLLAYKNVRQVIAAFERLPQMRLVVAGDGPERAQLEALAPGNVTFTGAVEDDELRWLYGSCSGLVSASVEDFGLTPLEAGLFGKPAALLKSAGFRDAAVEGETAVFFDDPDPLKIAIAVQGLAKERWSATRIRENARKYSEERFIERIRGVVDDELALV